MKQEPHNTTPPLVAFIAGVKEKEVQFLQALEILTASHQSIDKNYIDHEGNTLMHYVFIALVSAVQSFYEPTKIETRTLWQHRDSKKPQVTLLAEQCKALVTQMLSLDFLGNAPNNRNETPAFLLLGITGPNHPFLFVRDMFLEIFEQKFNIFYPGRKYVSDVTLYRNSKHQQKRVDIPNKWEEMNQCDGLDLTIHQRLALTERYLFYNYSSLNIAVANLGFITSDKPKQDTHGRIFVTVPIWHPNWLIIKHGPRAAESSHSEGGLCHFLKQPANLRMIISQLNQKGLQPGCKIYAVILDVFSTREVCLSCDSHLHALQTETHANSFISALYSQLQLAGYLLGKSQLPIIMRMGGIYHPGPSDPDKSYLRALSYENYNTDIKHFPPGVRLHLPPRACLSREYFVNDPHRCQHCYKRFLFAAETGDEPCICTFNPRHYCSGVLQKKIFGARFPQTERAYQEQWSSMQNKPFSFFLNTGFVNSGGKAQSVKRQIIPGQSQTRFNNCTTFKYLQEALLA